MLGRKIRRINHQQECHPESRATGANQQPDNGRFEENHQTWKMVMAGRRDVPSLIELI